MYMSYVNFYPFCSSIANRYLKCSSKIEDLISKKYFNYPFSFLFFILQWYRLYIVISMVQISHLFPYSLSPLSSFLSIQVELFYLLSIRMGIKYYNLNQHVHQFQHHNIKLFFNSNNNRYWKIKINLITFQMTFHPQVIFC